MNWSDKLRKTTFIQRFGSFGSSGWRCAMGVIDDVDSVTSSKNYLISKLYISPTDLQVNIIHECEYVFVDSFAYLSTYVMHLNDVHRNNFNEIADIIEPIELEHRLETKTMKEEAIHA